MMLTSCGTEIGENERLEYVAPAEVGKNVLLVDFTGQRCVNCPKANEEIEKLQEQYGGDTVIAVGMHSGPPGFKGNSKVLGLATDLGDTYYNYWGIEYQPTGVIDYLGKFDYPAWAATVTEQLQKTTTVTINATAEGEGTDLHGSVTVEFSDELVRGNLQLWLVEDSITALQSMPDGSVNKEYLHMHVFRDAVNGTWGTDLTSINSATWNPTMNYEYTLNEGWNRDHMWLIAFVYDDSGVLQVIRKHL
jgi:thiol-disulfide isomerase/thioredoxin